MINFFSDVSCGHKYTLAVAFDGSVYAWGSNEQGQCGLESLSVYYTPKVVSCLTRKSVQKICAGYQQSTCLTEDGEAYVTTFFPVSDHTRAQSPIVEQPFWNEVINNSVDSLNENHSRSHLKPKFVRVTPEQQWKQIAVSSFTPLMVGLTSEGAVYEWRESDETRPERQAYDTFYEKNVHFLSIGKEHWVCIGDICRGER